MANTQLSSKLGSNNSIFDVNERPSIKRSKFDFSRKIFTTLDIGPIVPLDWFDVFMGDHIKLNLRYLLNTFPLVVPPMNNYRIRTHWYYIRKSDLVESFETFLTKGRDGSFSDLKLPTATFWVDDFNKGPMFSSLTDDFADITGNQPNINRHDNYQIPLLGPSSLGSYLGLPIYSSDPVFNYLPNMGFDTERTLSTRPLRGNLTVSVLPFLAYQKIFRHAYVNPNLLQGSQVWFPSNLADHWRINFDCSNVDSFRFVPSGTPPSTFESHSSFVPRITDDCVNLAALRYAPFEMDYFTSAKPWLVRGNETPFDMDFDISSSVTEFIDKQTSWQPDDYVEEITGAPLRNLNGTSDVSTVHQNSTYGSHGTGLYGWTSSDSSRPIGVTAKDLTGAFNINLRNVRGTVNLTANTLRALLATSVWQERNALTDGSYNQFGEVHFGKNPKTHDSNPYYLGGTSDLVSFGEVLQTSQSNVESGHALGQSAGIGSANGASDVFEFTVPDHGIIMGVMIISPEVVYTGGIGHEWTDVKADDYFSPEFASLGYQPILNKEICFSGDEQKDNDLFGYQTRFAYLKQRFNKVSGLFGLPSSSDRLFNAYVQKRDFINTPELSIQFATMDPHNIDRSFLAYPSQPAFKLQFASDVELIRALPYQSTPNTFGF